MKHYLINVIHVSDNLADLFFIIFCVTAPISGILFGGFYVKKIGGYANLEAMYFIMFCTFSCFSLGLTLAFIRNTYVFAVLMWLFLFFGSSMVPSLNGSLLSSLPANLKGSGYSFQNVVVHLLGNTPAPSFYGYIYERTKHTVPTLALSLSLCVSGIGFILVSAVLYLKKKKHRLEAKMLISDCSSTSTISDRASTDNDSV